MIRVLAALGVAVALCAVASANDPRQAGERLREGLAKGPRKDLTGTQRLRVHLGASRPVGSLVLRTDLVEHEGKTIYRLVDRMNLDLPGLGSARLRVEADLSLGLRPLRVVLETEEPRGAGVLSRQLIVLEKGPKGWVRSITRGYGKPTVEALDLSDDVLVLTPPAGVGERLARVVPEAVGQRYKLPAYDLETGLTTTWRASVEELSSSRFKHEEADVPTLRLLRQEGPAKLEALRERAVGGQVLRLRRAGSARLTFLDPRLLDVPDALSSGPTGCVLVFLRALAAGDRKLVSECLDVDAIYERAGGSPANLERRVRFEEVLLGRLTDPDWLEAQGLTLAAGAVEASDLVATGPDGGPAQVRPKDGAGAFRVAREGERWKIVALPE